MHRKYLLAGTAFLAFLMVLSIAVGTRFGSGNDAVARATTEAKVVESAHNYVNNYDYTWTITKTGATWMKVHFTQITTETNYDYVYLYDKSSVQKAKYTGTYAAFWSLQITGDTVKVRLKTDYSIVKWGFKIDQIQYETSSGDTTAPTVSITAPTNGATVKGTVTVSISATDNVGVTARYLSVDSGTAFSVSSTYSWVTTSLADGSHTLKASAKDAAGNTGYSSLITVNVDNIVDPVNPGDTHFTGAVAGGETDWYSIVAYPGLCTVSTSWSGSYDIDDYICTTQSTSTYLARGYTTANPETCSYTFSAAGTYYIGVKMYTSSATSTSYDCHVTWVAEEPEEPEPSGDGWAVVVGISDYKAINDLSYCDEDATDWYNYLKNTMGYSTANMRVLGDGHTANYPAYYGYATEANYRACLTWVKDNIVSGNVCAFVTSGHGSGTGTGSSYLCAWDCSSGESGYDGNFYDTEIDDYTEAIAAKGAKVFVFIDHCYSGGIGPELTATANKANVYVTTTCTANGYGYDDPDHLNGAWTYWFLEAGLIAHFGSSTTTTMEAAFTYASGVYPHTGGDAAMAFDGNAGVSFLL
jgi:hypothetical protein